MFFSLRCMWFREKLWLQFEIQESNPKTVQKWQIKGTASNSEFLHSRSDSKQAFFLFYRQSEYIFRKEIVFAWRSSSKAIKAQEPFTPDVYNLKISVY